MSHPTGPKLDTEIAAHFARTSERSPLVSGYARRRQPVSPAPKYSTDIAAAWQLVGWLQLAGFEVALVTTAADRAHLGGWTCAVGNGTIGIKSLGDTAPLAISRAVLSLFMELERDRGG